MNFYLSLIAERSMDNSLLPSVYALNTFFYPKLRNDGYQSVSRWTKKVGKVTLSTRLSNTFLYMNIVQACRVSFPLRLPNLSCPFLRLTSSCMKYCWCPSTLVFTGAWPLLISMTNASHTMTPCWAIMTSAYRWVMPHGAQVQACKG